MLNYKFQYDFSGYPLYEYEVSESQLLDAIYHILSNNTNVFNDIKDKPYYKDNQFLANHLMYEAVCALLRSLDDLTFDNIVSEYWDELTEYFKSDAEEEYNKDE